MARRSPLKTLAEVRESRISLNICRVCGTEIKMMCRTGTGICSENCEKAEHEKGPGDYMAEAEAIAKAANA